MTRVATARCFSGEVVINGGYAGGEVRGSHPIDGGWTSGGGIGGLQHFRPDGASWVAAAPTVVHRTLGEHPAATRR